MLLSSTNGTSPVPAQRSAQPERATAPTAAPADAPAPAAAGGNGVTAPADVEKAVKTLNEFSAMAAQDLLFSIDEESGKSVVKVVDTATNEVLRQFPSVEALSIAKAIDKMQGLLIREKA